MIGQVELLKLINEQIEVDDFPRFAIISGQRGSGKKTLASYIVSCLNGYSVYHVPDIRVETIRQMIEESYKLMSPLVYIISDVDNMSVNAKNALLKVTEEPPQQAIFIMTVSDEESVLETLKSRACIYRMNPYSVLEVLEYAHSIGVEEDDIISELCETPGDVDRLNAIDIKGLYEYTNKVVDNIADVSLANAFKIADKIAFKDGEGYPVDLFLKAFRAICTSEVRNSVANDDIEGQMWYTCGVKITSKYLAQLSITGINKGALFDMFILDMRREWE